MKIVITYSAPNINSICACKLLSWYDSPTYYVFLQLSGVYADILCFPPIVWRIRRHTTFSSNCRAFTPTYYNFLPIVGRTTKTYYVFFQSSAVYEDILCFPPIVGRIRRHTMFSSNRRAYTPHTFFSSNRLAYTPTYYIFL